MSIQEAFSNVERAQRRVQEKLSRGDVVSERDVRVMLQRFHLLVSRVAEHLKANQQ